jgi:polar amino acid transport system substrate-binding protein
MMKYRSGLAALAVTAMLLSACSGTPSTEPSDTTAPEVNTEVSESAEPSATGLAAPATLVEAGKLSYGVAATFPPFEYKDGTTLTGFDVEMGQALAESMGLEVAPLDIDFDGLIPALNGKRIDIINSAMYINEERAEQVEFIPYMVVGEALLVPKGNPKGIKTLPDDLSGKTIAVTRGAIGETYMLEFNEELKAKGLDEMEIMALPTNQDALLAVESGRADGFDTSTPGSAYTQTEKPDVFELAGTFKLGTQIGIAVRKDDADTKAALEAALKAFVESGKYDELIAKYNLPAESSIF